MRCSSPQGTPARVTRKKRALIARITVDAAISTTPAPQAQAGCRNRKALQQPAGLPECCSPWPTRGSESFSGTLQGPVARLLFFKACNTHLRPSLAIPSAPCSRSAITPSRNAAAAAVQTEASVGAFTPSAPVIASAKLSSNAAAANAHLGSLLPTSSPPATITSAAVASMAANDTREGGRNHERRA